MTKRKAKPETTEQQHGGLGVGYTDFDQLAAGLKELPAIFAQRAAEERRLQAEALAEALASSGVLASSTAPPPSALRLSVTKAPPQGILDGTAYSITDDAAEFLEVLIAAGGLWCSGKKDFPLLTRPDRVRKKLPRPLRDLVESGNSRGYRIPREKLLA